MQIFKTSLNDAFVVEINRIGDNRGYFFESFNQEKFKLQSGLDINFVQDNQAYSVKNVVRGLHFQLPPFAQSKLVRAISGTILDIIIDLRQSSSTFGKMFSIELSSENNLQLFVPKGFAHGYSVLNEEGATVAYKCDEFYHPESESGLHPLDPSLNIDWKVNPDDMILSAKDIQWGTFKEDMALFK